MKKNLPTISEIQSFPDLFSSHFPGHTMQRVRTVDGKYRYNYVSPGIRELGLDPDDLIQREPVDHEWVHSDDLENFIAALEKSARELSVLDEETRVEFASGQYKWVRSIGHPRRLPDGSVIWDGVALDITDRREALEALERALSQTRLEEISDGRFSAIAARDAISPFQALDHAMQRLKGTQFSDRSKAQRENAVYSVVTAFDQFAKSFDAALGLINARQDETETNNTLDADADADVTAKVEMLTKRQREVLDHLKNGATNLDIALALNITEGTVKQHVSSILKTLGVKNRTKAVSHFSLV
ncbi:LuxR C-terminal-related transcriptional regulator [Sneathiella sp.]|uniref:LuxR C-terminal-related transcriptional regulator n=1 Tax=Sneathiella sp. TaxID=1964365 RepID=UPI003565D913